MTMAEIKQTEPPAKSRMDRTTLFLAIGQTVFWASTFYILPALMLDIQNNMFWSKAEVSAAMSGAILISALCARPAGHIIDQGYGKQLMSIGGICAGILLLLCSQISSIWQFYVCWIGLGFCMAATLYEPCFSIVTRHHGLTARRAITHITLIAGFAGTIAFPIATWLSAQFDWRSALLFFGTSVLLVAVPLSYFAITKLQTTRPFFNSELINPNSGTGVRNKTFWLITGAFTLGSINHTMIISHLLPMLNERGISSQFAVIAAMLVGPMQVVGRLLLMKSEKHISTRASALICFCGLTLSSAILWMAGINLAFIYVAACLHGATWGLVSITRPTLIRELLGANDFGATSGSVAAFAIFGIALAPSLGAWLWALGGYQLMLGVGTFLTCTGGLLIWLLKPASVAQNNEARNADK